VSVSPVTNGAGSLIQNGRVKLWYHHDRLGSTDFLTDNVSGKVTSYVAYDDWGAPAMKAVLKLGVRELDLVTECTGHPWDPVLGAYYARARMYDAADRRWLSMDPIKGTLENPQSINLYVYVLNNPLAYIDLFGLQEHPIEALKKIIDDPEEIDSYKFSTDTYYYIRDVFDTLGGTVDYYKKNPINGNKRDVTASLTYDNKTVTISYEILMAYPYNIAIYRASVESPLLDQTKNNSIGLVFYPGRNKSYINLDQLLTYFEKIWCEPQSDTSTSTPKYTPRPRSPRPTPSPSPSVPGSSGGYAGITITYNGDRVNSNDLSDPPDRRVNANAQWTDDARAVARIMHYFFGKYPYFYEIVTYDNYNPDGHPAKAIDMHLYSDQMSAVANPGITSVVEWIVVNRNTLNVHNVIYHEKIFRSTDTYKPYDKWASYYEYNSNTDNTSQHRDHVHLTIR